MYDIFFQLSVGELADSQKRKAVRMERHHKKMVEAYNNFESIIQVIHP
jgi:hypothetical protein